MRPTILNHAITKCFENRCPCSKYYHFCVTFRGRKILSTGSNCVCKKHTKFAFKDSLHAELDAISKIKDKTKPFDLLVIRTNETGDKLLISKPCSQCSYWINLGYYPIRKIYYSNGQGGIIVMNKIALLKPECLSETCIKTPIAHPRPIYCKQVAPIPLPVCPKFVVSPTNIVPV
jgi:tRNA(Arg) A34 adenosine deaminase TadA